MNRLTDIQKTWNYLKIMNKPPKNISRKFEKDSSSRTGDIIDNLFSVRNWGNEQTDRHTRNLEIFNDNWIIVSKLGNEQTDRHTRKFEII